MRSNCLFEAIRAKLRDPAHIHIHYFPLALNKGWFHVYWVDERDMYRKMEKLGWSPEKMRRTAERMGFKWRDPAEVLNWDVEEAEGDEKPDKEDYHGDITLHGFGR